MQLSEYEGYELKSKSELIGEWLEVHPNDKESPDLEHNATAGHYLFENGLYMHHRDYTLYLKNKGLIDEKKYSRL